MLIGYARVSTHDQHLDLQKDALQSAGCEKICVDEVSGAAAARPGLQQAMDVLREGDVLVVWRLDRLGRSLRNLIDLVGQLEDKKIGFRSLQESMDTSSSGGKLIFHVFGALVEFERNLIRERTQTGLSAARARGRKGGRPKSLDDKKRKLAVQLYRDRKHPIDEICQIVNGGGMLGHWGGVKLYHLVLSQSWNRKDKGGEVWFGHSGC